MSNKKADWPLTLFSVLITLAVMAGVVVIAQDECVVINEVSGLFACASLALLVQWIAWIPASLKKTETFYDLTGGLTYWAVLVLSLWGAHQAHGISDRAWLLSALVAIWAARLASFLYKRVHKAGKDRRFDQLKQTPTRFLVPWTIQGLWVFLTMLVVVMVNLQAEPAEGLGLLDAIGVGLWIVGFSIEVLADRQKSAFNAKPENRGKWIDEGLWSKARHPNYFGEILLWTGIAVAGSASLAGGAWVALISPVFVFILLTKISGVPLLEPIAQSRWGDDPEYQAYRERTRMLLPL